MTTEQSRLVPYWVLAAKKSWFWDSMYRNARNRIALPAAALEQRVGGGVTVHGLHTIPADVWNAHRRLSLPLSIDHVAGQQPQPWWSPNSSPREKSNCMPRQIPNMGCRAGPTPVWLHPGRLSAAWPCSRRRNRRRPTISYRIRQGARHRSDHGLAAGIAQGLLHAVEVASAVFRLPTRTRALTERDQSRGLMTAGAAPAVRCGLAWQEQSLCTQLIPPWPYGASGVYVCGAENLLHRTAALHELLQVVDVAFFFFVDAQSLRRW